MSEGIRPRRLPVPGPMTDEAAGLEARLRRKLDTGEPLTPSERALLAELPARREIPADVVREAARRAGGVAPHPAAEHPEDAASSPDEDPALDTVRNE